MALTVKQFCKRKVSKLTRKELEAEARKKGGCDVDPTHMTDSEIRAFLICGELPVGHQYAGKDVSSHGRISKVH